MTSYIALALVEGIGLAAKHKLLRTFGSPEGVFERKIDKDAFPRMKNAIDFAKIRDKHLASAKRIADFCERENVRAICLNDKKYPPLLRQIPQAPLVLYCRGDIDVLSKRSVAIVGTREPNANGEADAREISLGLSQNGFVIVSGLAKGIDTVAHESALSANAPTVAVMATGINQISPAQNTNLAEKIVKNGGAIITEQVPGNLAFAPNFVMRNRIISGLCECSIIICAPEKSGALRTAEFARQQGRKILVAPGTRSDEKYDGSNKLLLKKDVSVALKISGIISYLNGTQEVEQIGIFDVPQKDFRGGEGAPPQEKGLLSIIGKTPISLETLSQKSGIEIGELAEILFDMELEGAVRQDISGNYCRRL